MPDGTTPTKAQDKTYQASTIVGQGNELDYTFHLSADGQNGTFDVSQDLGDIHRANTGTIKNGVAHFGDTVKVTQAGKPQPDITRDQNQQIFGALDGVTQGVYNGVLSDNHLAIPAATAPLPAIPRNGNYAAMQEQLRQQHDRYAREQAAIDAAAAQRQQELDTRQQPSIPVTMPASTSTTPGGANAPQMPQAGLASAVPSEKAMSIAHAPFVPGVTRLGDGSTQVNFIDKTGWQMRVNIKGDTFTEIASSPNNVVESSGTISKTGLIDVTSFKSTNKPETNGTCFRDQDAIIEDAMIARMKIAEATACPGMRMSM